jgi:hypothetical protein
VCVCGAGLHRSQECSRGYISRENVFKIDDVTLEGDTRTMTDSDSARIVFCLIEMLLRVIWLYSLSNLLFKIDMKSGDIINI